jgi:hypothetical protein
VRRLIIALVSALFCTGVLAQPSQLPVPGGGATVVGSFTAGDLLVANSSGQITSGPAAGGFGHNIVFAGGTIETLGSITGGSAYTAGNIPLTLGAITAGSGYVTGQYNGVATTTGGAGTGATANVTVGGDGTVTAFILATRGTGYAVADTLSVSNANLGGSGSGLLVPIATVGYPGVSLTGGAGSGATANISVSAGGAVNAVTIVARGTGYASSDTLSANSASIGGTGSGFTIPVSAVGAINGPANMWYTVNGLTLTGVIASPSITGNITPFQIYVGGDSVDTNNTNLNVFSVVHASSTGTTGGRTVILGSESIVGTPTSLSSAGNISVSGITRVSANMTGTTGAYANYKGNTFGGGFNIFTTAGATFISLVNAQENDVALEAGSSAAEKHALTIVQTAGDAVRATYDDNAIEFGAQDGTTTTWKTGIMFGAYAHKWSFGTDSTLISTQTRTVGAASASVALNGVDMSGVTFSGSAFIAPAGSISHMSYAFSANVATGLYSAGANQVNLCANGNCVLVNGSGTFIAQLGLTVSTGLVTVSGIASDATHTDATVCEDTTTHAFYSGSGAAGICLGTSSERYKHGIADLDVGTEELMRLRPVQYYLNADHGDSDKLLYGFTAEQGMTAFPKLVGLDDEGRPNTFDYLGVVPPLVKGFQDHETRLRALEMRKVIQ